MKTTIYYPLYEDMFIPYRIYEYPEVFRYEGLKERKTFRYEGVKAYKSPETCCYYDLHISWFSVLCML